MPKVTYKPSYKIVEAGNIYRLYSTVQSNYGRKPVINYICEGTYDECQANMNKIKEMSNV